MKNQEKKGILVISFGTSYQGTRKRTLDVIEEELKRAFGDYAFRRAYTSPTIVRILRERDNIHVDGVEEALERLVRDGFRTVVVQTTHVIRGFEYERMRGSLEKYRPFFEQLVCGEPLLTSEADYEEAVKILGQELEQFRRSDTDLILMGHGTEHAANSSYSRLQQVFIREGYGDFLVGTVEASPTLENMVALVEKRRSRRVVLTPFLVVAGEHVCKDMAGENENSWKSRFLRKGYEVECLMKGIGEYPGIRQMYVRHAKEAERQL
ncbi:MAG: sirohydrochlorin cobaltochelatase [Lachnospiraceae bacterium]|jgi:cobalamin biosynthesis Co2+ chelatase CbiK|nr:sirohydrochlorin cobaltochelatase [Lachnospiraceae bacterium]